MAEEIHYVFNVNLNLFKFIVTLNKYIIIIIIIIYKEPKLFITYSLIGLLYRYITVRSF